MKFFVDSNIFIEPLKKQASEKQDIAKKLLSFLLENLIFSNSIVINSIVWDETIFHLIVKGKSYDKSLTKNFLFHLFSLFEWLNISKEAAFLGLGFIEKYKLKTHDALILATCKHYNIKYLISIDNDFTIPCEKEGIVLIDSVEKLKEVLNKQFS
jgi:predicted nucleic acid-binding protein